MICRANRIVDHIPLAECDAGLHREECAVIHQCNRLLRQVKKVGKAKCPVVSSETDVIGVIDEEKRKRYERC